MLIIGGLLAKIYHPNLLLRRITIGLILVSLYFAVGTGLLHYQGEGGAKPESLVLNNEVQVDYYYIDLHNGLHLPININFMVPIGQKNLEITNKSKVVNNDSHLMKFNFKVTGDHPRLPNKLIVVYRALGVIPLIAPFEFTWPDRIKGAV